MEEELIKKLTLLISKLTKRIPILGTIVHPENIATQITRVSQWYVEGKIKEICHPEE